MTAAQMLAHCQQPLRVALGELPLKRMLIGVLFGRMAKKKLLSSTPWKPGMPTAREFLVKEARDFETEKQKLLLLVQRDSRPYRRAQRSGTASAEVSGSGSS